MSPYSLISRYVATTPHQSTPPTTCVCTTAVDSCHVLQIPQEPCTTPIQCSAQRPVLLPISVLQPAHHPATRLLLTHTWPLRRYKIIEMEGPPEVIWSNITLKVVLSPTLDHISNGFVSLSLRYLQGGSKNSVGILFWCFTILFGKTVSLMCNLYLPSCNLS